MNRFFSRPHWWDAAREQQLVQGDVPADDPGEPTALLIAITMLGTLVCVLPLAAFVLLMMGEQAWSGGAGLLLGLMALGGGAALLRGSRQAFASCIALVLWGIGAILLAINFGLDVMNSRPGLMALCVAAALLQMLGAGLSQARWIQAVMGAGWAAAVLVLLLVLQSWWVWLTVLVPETLLLALLWLLWLRSEPRRLVLSQQGWADPRWAVFADAAIVGVLLGVIWMRFGSQLDLLRYMLAWEVKEPTIVLMRVLGALPVVVVLAATGVLLRGWQRRGLLSRSLQHLLLLAGGLLAVCAWFSPSLAGVSLVAVGALLTARWRIAALCVLTALVLLGNFYYQLAWPLAIKGLGLAVLGAVLLLGLLLQRRSSAADTAKPAASAGAGKWQLGCLLLGALLVFGLVNWDVRGKEHVIAQGQRILVPLVPVDPRSLMQGDYMDLRFDLPQSVMDGLEKRSGPTAHVSAQVDGQGVATVKALLDQGQAAGPGEIMLPLKRLKGRWTLVTNAYFFPEGQGDHFAKGRFGDFRVLPDGRALLVGLADAQKQEIKPLPGGSIWDARPAAQRLEEQRSQPDVDEPAQPATNTAAEQARQAARRAADAVDAAMSVQPASKP